MGGVLVVLILVFVGWLVWRILIGSILVRVILVGVILVGVTLVESILVEIVLVEIVLVEIVLAEIVLVECILVKSLSLRVFCRMPMILAECSVKVGVEVLEGRKWGRCGSRGGDAGGTDG